MSKTLCKVNLTPAERFTLCLMLHNPEVPVKSSLEGKALRRTLRSLGMDEIRKTMVANEGKVSTKMANNQSPSLFTLTEEAADVIKDRVSGHKRKPQEEFTVGEFLDKLDGLSSAPADETGVEFNPAEENWVPPGLEDLVELTDDQIAKMKEILTPKQYATLFG